MKDSLSFKRKILFLICWTFMFTLTKAQPSLAFYPLTNQFSSFDYNPAFLTSHEKFTFSIFPLAGTSVEFNNQKVINSMTSKFFKGSLDNQDYKNAFNDIMAQSSFHQNLESSLLSFTYRSDIGFFNFRIKESEYFLAKVEGDITKFIFKSDIQSAVIDQIQSLPAQSAHYREYSLGYAFQSPHKRFTAGIRAKLYFGKFAFFSNVSGSIQNKFNDYVLKTSGLIQISFPENTIYNPKDSSNTFNFSSSKIFDYLLNSGNPGMGVDLGINYRVSPDLTCSMSIIDLGKINWKSHVNSRRLNEEYLLANSTYQTSTEGGVQTITKNENYTYSDSFDFAKLAIDSTTFSNPMPLSIYAGIKYRVNPGFSLDMTDKYVVVKDLSYNSLSVTAQFDVNKKLSVSAGYSMIGDSYFNIPLALLYQGNFGQIFLGTDNLTTLALPSSAQYAGISFGACFYLFTHRNLSVDASDYTPFYRPRKIIKNHRTGLILNDDSNK
ncbi:MAG TPA: hypothetical protein DCL77_01780 [Prolixibacteraceae bacterium]|jgi:hypothetical protein|nr:hypothetical protein [Prolixibacteraceae bacterium]